MIILGIESSCDETAAAVLAAPRSVQGHVVASQIDAHGPYGGVVPEIACREHVKALPIVIEEALQASGCRYPDLEAIAVTYGPGLAGSLLTGLAAARALSTRLGIPLLAVNHLHGHLFSPFLDPDSPDPATVYPFLSLIVSGGHSCLVRVTGPGHYQLLGTTVDDAAGEAFDKGANLLGLGYPGGHRIEALAVNGDCTFHRFPRGRVTAHRSWPDELIPELCFSFSGLKTALRYWIEQNPLPEDEPETLSDLAASYQEAIVDALVQRTRRAWRMLGLNTLAVGGGVSLNQRLRDRLHEAARADGVQVLLTPPAYCGDNAAMIALVAALGAAREIPPTAPLDADPSPHPLF